MGARGTQIAAWSVLLAAGLYTFAVIFAFSQGRFFTVDEYQYGHATWLVSRGRVPYVDFFEHHFPGSYVLHAPFYWVSWSFETAALLLRKIVFGYWVLVSILAAWTCFQATRDRFAAALTALLPVSFGFSLMSAIDYRADNFGAVYFLACLALLEWNRTAARRGVAILAGVLAVIASVMTQKMTFIAGSTLAIMWALDGLKHARGRPGPPFIAHPIPLFTTVFSLGAILLGIGGALGMLPRGFEWTILQAFQHEELYQPFSLLEKGYVTPFWSQTWPSTLAIAVFAAGFLATRRGRFWLLPLAVSAVGASLIAAPYPYNFVFSCFVAVLASVRGFSLAISWVAERIPALEDAKPLLYLLPLAAIANQISFVANTTTNDHQLRVLRKIEKYGEPWDAVIDNAGGAMFSPDASYYYYHGRAHRQIFHEYFSKQLVDDYRKSRALFWIRDMRYTDLPQEPRDYLGSHYVHGGDGLYVLGLRTPATRSQGVQLSFDVVRAGNYYIQTAARARTPSRVAGKKPKLIIDGRVVSQGRVQLDVGVHEIEVPPHSDGYLISAVHPWFFEEDSGPARYTLMFEYRDAVAAQFRTDYTFAEHAPPGALAQKPGSSLEFRIQLPERPRLFGRVALRGEPGARSAKRGMLEIEIRGRDEQEVLVSQSLSAGSPNAGLEIDSNLLRYAGETVDIVLRFDAPEPASGLVLEWTDLRIAEELAPD